VKRFLAAAAFVIVATPAFAQFGQNKIVYDKFRWNVYHATHFDIYFYDEEKPSLQKVVDNAESAYDDLSRKFNFQISKKIPLIFYATHSAFEQTNVDLNFIPEAVGAFAEPVRNRMVIPIDTTDEKLLQLITHELTHVFEYEILFQGKLGKTIAASPEHAVAHYNLAVLYDEHDSLALAFDHYHAFLKHAGPEHASLVAAVQLRVLALESTRDRPGP